MMDGACQQEARATATGPFHAMIDVMDSVRGYGVATTLAHGSNETMNNVHQQNRDSVGTNPGDGMIQWHSRYDGLVTIAQLGDKAVAGISGPWSGQYALTWWDRPLSTRHLELFDSLDDAKREVEEWARRMRTGNYSLAASSLQPGATPTRVQAPTPVPAQAPTCTHASQPDLLARMRALLPSLRMQKPNAASLDSIECLRRQQACANTDISDLHFAARD
jgi:hypothetical protein